MLLVDHRLRRGQQKTVREEYMKGGVGQGAATTAAVPPRSKFTQREGEGSGRRQGLTEKEKERERATSAGAFLHAVSHSHSVQSFLSVCMEISKRWRARGS
ncbi:hypothetical protein EYF80_008903 [Liparis tanakae]|uniref:Uncharacterized protein n=1 Tax=Liparis tanakae TaxID=230148 RepID=A0A4Z2ITH7_9TELE|nr:hypothetical protein EYF80_008903 [Liparis tanakae]